MNIIFKLSLCLLCSFSILGLNGQTFLKCGTIDPTDEEMEKKYYFGNNDTLDIVSQNALKYFEKNLYSLPIQKGGGLINSKSAGQVCGSVDGMVMVPVRFNFFYDRINHPDVPTQRELKNLIEVSNNLFRNNGLAIRLYMLTPLYTVDSRMNSIKVSSISDNARFPTNEPNCININVVENIEDGGAYYNSYYDFIVIQRSVYDDLQFEIGNSVLDFSEYTVLTHELGHFFGLDHTFLNSDKGKCRQEAVSRSRRFRSRDCLFRFGTICQRNGDALCDTEADYESLRNDIVNNDDCNYTGNRQDEYGENYRPSPFNIMAYTLTRCRNTFSSNQSNIMRGNLARRATHVLVDYNHIDADRYEPDNNAQMRPTELVLDQLQCHSLHNFDKFYGNDEMDAQDWLQITDNDFLGNYVVVIDDFDGVVNPFGSVTFWYTDGQANLTGQVPMQFQQVGTERRYSISCADRDGQPIFVQVTRDGNNTSEGAYAITLRSDIDVSISSPNRTSLCVNDEYHIENLPTGATVVWQSNRIFLSNSSGNSTTITGYNNTGPYIINADISYNGCTNRLSKELLLPINATNMIIQSIGNPNSPCYNESTSKPGRYRTSLNLPVAWSCPDADIYTGGIESTTVTVHPRQEGNVTLTATYNGGCIPVAKNYNVTFSACPGDHPKIVVNPNPASETLYVEAEVDFDPATGLSFKIFSMVNVEELAGVRDSRSFSVDISALKAGTYYLIVTANNISEGAYFVKL